MDPHDAAWLVVLRPDDWASGKALLTPGFEVAELYLELMQEADFAKAAPGHSM